MRQHARRVATTSINRPEEASDGNPDDTQNECFLCRLPILDARRALVRLALVDASIIDRPAHVGCAARMPRDGEWRLISVLEYSVCAPLHVALHGGLA